MLRSAKPLLNCSPSPLRRINPCSFFYTKQNCIIIPNFRTHSTRQFSSTLPMQQEKQKVSKSSFLFLFFIIDELLFFLIISKVAHIPKIVVHNTVSVDGRIDIPSSFTDIGLYYEIAGQYKVNIFTLSRSLIF